MRPEGQDTRSPQHAVRPDLVRLSLYSAGTNPRSPYFPVRGHHSEFIDILYTSKSKDKEYDQPPPFSLPVRPVPLRRGSCRQEFV